MFPDSPIAQNFKLGRDKCGYVTNFGLGPFFQSTVREEIKMKDHIVLMFDESYNDNMGKQQMDIYFRFWDGNHVGYLFY